MSRVIFYSNFKMNGHDLACFQKNTRWLITIKHKQSARIKRKNNLFKPCVRSKQSRTIKTIICSYIFTSLRRKKFKVRLNSSRNCSVCVRITFENGYRRFRGLTKFVFNFGVWSLEQSVKLDRLLIFDFLGNSLL